MNKIYLHLALVAVSIFIGYKATDLHWSKKWTDAELKASQNQLNAVNEAVKIHNQKVTDLEQMNRDTEKKLADARLNNLQLDNTNNSLQQQFTDSLRRQSTCDQTATVAELAAAATNRTVQAHVFGVVTNRAVEYAKIADDNRVRGLACEAQYKIVMEK